MSKYLDKLKEEFEKRKGKPAACMIYEHKQGCSCVIPPDKECYLLQEIANEIRSDILYDFMREFNTSTNEVFSKYRLHEDDDVFDLLTRYK